MDFLIGVYLIMVGIVISTTLVVLSRLKKKRYKELIDDMLLFFSLALQALLCVIICILIIINFVMDIGGDVPLAILFAFIAFIVFLSFFGQVISYLGDILFNYKHYDKPTLKDIIFVPFFLIISFIIIPYAFKLHIL